MLAIMTLEHYSLMLFIKTLLLTLGKHFSLYYRKMGLYYRFNKTTFLDWFQKKYLCFTIKDLNKTLNICSNELQVAWDQKNIKKLWKIYQNLTTCTLWPFAAVEIEKHCYFDVNLQVVAMNALTVSKKVCRGCLLVV